MKIITLLFMSALMAISCAPTKPDPIASVFPRVISPGWKVSGDGQPSMDVTGFSRVTYTRDGAPDDVAEVYFLGSKGTAVQGGNEESVTIMGKAVATYASGNEDPAFSTQPVQLTSPNGKTAYYSFQFHGENFYKNRQKIPQFGW
jgi:hypothetical protein